MRKVLGIILSSITLSVGIVVIEAMGWLKVTQGSKDVPDWALTVGALAVLWVFTFVVVLMTLSGSSSDERATPDEPGDDSQTPQRRNP